MGTPDHDDDPVGQDADELLAVVAVPVALGCGLQVGEVLRGAGGEGLVDVGPGGGEGGERPSGEAGGERATKQLAALHLPSFRAACWPTPLSCGPCASGTSPRGPVQPPPTTSGPQAGGLVRSRRLIVAARSRNAIPSDGGGTGKSDNND